MKIELINPPHPDASEDRLDAPLGLLYIAASLEKAGYDVRVNDLTGKTDLIVGEADIYGITIYAPTVKLSEDIARKCRIINPECKVIVGGAHPTAVPETITFADSIVIGEGELAMLDVVKDYPELKSRYQKALDKNLDLYPNPAYHLIDVHSYKRLIGGERALTMLTTKGCPYRCAFCGLADHHKTVKTRSPKAVAREIKEIKAEYGIRKFNFQDDSFVTNRRRLYELLDLMRPLGIGFRCHGRVGNDRPKDYEKLKDAGCDVIAWGIESGSQKILDKMNKRVTVRQNYNAVQMAKDAGLLTRCFFIIGFPGETAETLEETKRFIEQSDPDQYFVSNFVPYPGTDVWNNPKKYGITKLNKDFDNYFQIDKTGYGGITISTKMLSAADFSELEIDFRMWLNRRKLRGCVQEYESNLLHAIA